MAPMKNKAARAHPHRAAILSALLTLARAPSGPAGTQESVAALAGVVDWPLLYTAAHGSGMLSLLSLRLSGPDGSDVPEETRTALRAWLQSNLVRSVRASAEIVRVCTRLEAQGIRTLPFKGPVLAQLLYGDLAAREFADLDILVDPERYWDAYDLLVADGYAPDAATAVDVARKLAVPAA